MHFLHQSLRRAALVFIIWMTVSQTALADDIRTVSLKTTDILYDPVNRLIFASVPSDGGTGVANTVTAIHPEAGIVVFSIPVGLNPTKLAVSDDGLYLYVVVDGLDVIKRIDLPGQRVDSTFDVPFYPNSTERLAVEDLQVQPGHNNVVAASLYMRFSSPHHVTLAIFKDGVQLPSQTPIRSDGGPNYIRFGAAPEELFGLSIESGPVKRFAIGPTGIESTTTYGNAFDVYLSRTPRMEYANGRLYANNGSVLDPITMKLLGTYPYLYGGWERPDPEHNRVYFMYDGTIQSFDLERFNFVDQLQVERFCSSCTHLIRWGDQGLAFRSRDLNKVWLVRTRLVPPTREPVAETSVTQETIGEGIRALRLPATDMIYDTSRRVIYASIPGSVAGHLGNTIAIINGETSTVVSSIFIGSEPGKLTLSEDNQYLYVALSGVNAIRRINLVTQNPDLFFYIPDNAGNSPLFAEDMQVQPGNPNVLAVSVYKKGRSARFEMVAIFENGIKRPEQANSYGSGIAGIANSIAFGGSPGVLYGYNSEVSEFALRQMTVNAAGVTPKAVLGKILGADFYDEIAYAAGRLYSTSGTVLNVADNSLAGMYPSVGGPMFPDVERERAYFLANPDPFLGPSQAAITITAFHLTRFNYVGELRIPSPDNGSQLIRWGDQGLAYLTTGKIVLVSTPLVPPRGAALPRTEVSQVQVAPGVRSLRLAVQHIVYDRRQNLIYGSVPGIVAGDLGNCVVAITPETGEIAYSLFVGSEPTKLALSADGKYLYVALIGVNAVRRVDLATREVNAIFYMPNEIFALQPEPLFPEDIQVQPNDSNVLAVSLYRKNVLPRFGGVAIFDNGVKRPTVLRSETENVVRFGGTSATLYGLNNESTERGLRKMRVDETGVTMTSSTRNAPGVAGGISMEYASGRIYLSSGQVLNAADMSSAGTYGVAGSVRPDVGRDRVYFLSRNGTTSVVIRSFGLSDFTSKGETVIASTGQPQYLIRWGSSGLAFATNNYELFITQDQLVPTNVTAQPQPLLQTVTPSSIGLGSGSTRIRLVGSAFMPESVVRINGHDAETIFSGDEELLAIVDSTDLLTAGTLSVGVFTPGASPGSSEVKSIVVLSGSRPTIDSIIPGGALTQTEVNATITGSNLDGASRITFSGSGVTARIVSATATSITARITVARTANAGIHTFTIDSSNGTSFEYSGLTVVESVGERIGVIPNLQATVSTDMGIALTNPTNQEAIITLIARDFDGEIISGTGITNPARIVLPASMQTGLRSREVFGWGIAGRNAWIDIVSSSVATKGMFLVFDPALTYLDGAEIQAPVSRSILFPKVSISSTSSTFLSFVNTSDEEIEIRIWYNGTAYGAPTRRIPARSGFAGPASLLLPQLTSFSGYIVIEHQTYNPQPILAGFETYQNQTDVAALNGMPEGTSSQRGYIPHFASQGGYRSRIAFVNDTPYVQTVRVTAGGLQRNGQALPDRTVERTVRNKSRLEEPVDEMFGFTGNELITGYIKWEALRLDPTSTAETVVSAYVDYGTSNGVTLASVPSQSQGASDILLSQVAEGLGYFTGIALFNPGDTTTAVTIDVLTNDGRIVGSTVLSLSSNGRLSRLIRELIPSANGQVGGYVHIRSTSPIIAIELFGSMDSDRFLANVPAQRAYQF
jgi:DNA-binding beta-propeller fold protein YncE